MPHAGTTGYLESDSMEGRMTARMTACLSLVAFAGALLWASSAGAQTSERPLYVPGEIIIKFEDRVAAAARQAALSRNGVRVFRELRGIGALYGALPAGADVIAAAARLESLAQVRYAEPNYIYYIDGIPNDPRFSSLWGLHNTGQTGGTPDADIDAPEAWDIATGDDGVIIAVIDSGTDFSHVDLAANMFTNPGEVVNGIDDDGNGFVDDLRGWDFVDGDNDVRDNSPECLGHGTHTAGTAGAVGNNGTGITGVAQNVSILPIRALGPFEGDCVGFTADLVDGIDYAAMMGAHISNNSWGGGGFSTAIRDAIAASRHLFVAAAGNAGRNNDTSPFYPASYPLDNIVAVAATDHNDNKAGFSNFGTTSVDLAAPGVNTFSTLPGDFYGSLSGTSMAAPHVAGAAAVLLGANSGLTVAELKDRLLRGTDGLGLPVATGGRLNLNGTLLIPDWPLIITLTPLGPTSVFPGDLIEFDVTVENTSGSTLAVDASVRAWLKSGAEFFLVGPVNITVAAGGTVQATVSETVPFGLPAGDYFMIGRVSRGAAIEEAQLVYTVN
jgi:subtilisin family serine protease